MLSWTSPAGIILFLNREEQYFKRQNLLVKVFLCFPSQFLVAVLFLSISGALNRNPGWGGGMEGVTETLQVSCLQFCSQGVQGVLGHPPWLYLLPSRSEVWESLPGGAFSLASKSSQRGGNRPGQCLLTLSQFSGVVSL